MAIPSTNIPLSRLYRKGKVDRGSGLLPFPTSTVKAGAWYLSMNQSFKPAELALLSGSLREYPDDMARIFAMMCARAGV